MHLVIHDASLRKVAFVDNTKQNTLKYIKYEWYRSLETAGSTFTVTIKKMAIQTDNHYEVAYNHLNERSFITFKKKNKTHLFSVMVVTEDEETITCTCESANLELINEYANPYKASKPMTFVEYCNAMGLLSFTYLTIGLNEVSDKSLTLELESQETKLARLLSLANKFDAEIEFDTRLNADSSIKQFILNVYHENDDTHQGVGRIREDVRLVYGKNIKSVTRTIDKTNVVNAIRPTGTKDGNTVVISGLSAWEEKNEDGVVEFYQKGEMLHAPISMQMYPSTFTHSTIDDQWTRKDITVDSDNPTVIRAEGIKALKRLAYPSITYEVDGFIDADIGDTVKVIDNGFVPKLILKARVIEQYIYDDETRNKAVLGNFTALKSRISDGIQAAFERLFEASKPYLIKLSTDNGVIFKNQIGQSIITPSLYKGGKPVTTNVTWRWALDGNVTTGMTYTVRGADVTDTATLTVAAYVGNDEVAVDEISFANVLDGAQGTPGRDGVDGIAGKDGVGIASTDITYYLSTSGITTPTTGWSSSVPTLIKGRYLWTRTIWTYTDGQKETGYQVTYIAQDGNNGTDGLPGKDGVGITSTSITYARSTSGTSAPTSGWTSAVPSVPPGEFLWTKTVWTYTDNTNETGYSVARIGADGRTPYVHWAYADNADGTGLTTSDNGQRYMGHYSDFTQADSVDKTKYRWADRWARLKLEDNLLLNSSFNQNFDKWEKYGATIVDGKARITGEFNKTKYIYQSIKSQIANDDVTQVYIASFSVKVTNYVAGSVNPYLALYIDGGKNDSNNTWYGATYLTPDHFHVVNNKGVVQFTTVFKVDVPRSQIGYTRFYVYARDFTGEVEFEKLSLRRGDIDLGWQPAREDIQANIDSKADQELTQQQLNLLTEKAQQMQTELEAKVAMETLSGLERAYKAYVEANDKAVAKSQADLIEAGRRVDATVEVLGGLSKTKKFIDTYIKEAEEGIIIGTNDNVSQIRVTHDRIAMYSAGKEVMYISQGVIHIDNGVFTKSLQIGRFITAQHESNHDINICRYVG